MTFKIQSSMLFKLAIGCLLINLSAACAGLSVLSPGSWVEEKDRIPVLDGGPHKGSWQTRDLTINYEYQETGQSLQMSGVIDLADYITNGFSTLDYLRLHIHFLDADGTVMDTQSVKTFGYRRYMDLLGKMTFNNRFNWVENTVSVAFSYSGKASSGGGSGIADDTNGRIDWDFWKVPRRSPPK